MTAQVIRADARCLPLADASVDLIVTSPPYFALRSYQDGGEHYIGQIGDEATPAAFVDALIACTREWLRVLKPSGSLWVNLGDKYAQSEERSRNGNGNRVAIDGFTGGKPLRGRTVTLGRKNNGVPRKSLIGIPWRYALRCIDEMGLILRAEVIWAKPNGLPESVTDRVRRSHEHWFHFTMQPRYFSAVDDAKHPGSVWTVATEPLRVPQHLGVDHFAAFPSEWPRRIIQGWAPVDGIVLDPFGGTGTTALVASVLGRVGVSVDLSSDYCRLARWRTTDPDERARAMRVGKPSKQASGQLDLLGEAS